MQALGITYWHLASAGSVTVLCGFEGPVHSQFGSGEA